MAEGLQIGQLPQRVDLTGNELIPFQQGRSNGSISSSTLKKYIGAGGGTDYMKYITEYNVSVQHPTSGIDGSNKYSLEGAIAQVPQELRDIGLKVLFINTDNQVENWEYQGIEFSDVKNWIQSGAQKINNLDEKIENETVKKNPSSKQVIYSPDEALNICDNDGKVFCRISPKGVQAFGFFDGNGDKVGNNSIFNGKSLFTLCDSLGVSGLWQARLCELTGMKFDNTLNNNPHHAISVGGTQTGVFNDEDGLSRAQNLVQLKEAHKIDVLMIENINDYAKALGEFAGDIRDRPWMPKNKLYASDTVYTTGVEVNNYWDTNFNDIIGRTTPTVGTVFMFRMSYEATAYRITIKSQASKNGSLIINVGGNSFNVEVTTGMSIEEIVEKIIEWQYTAGWSDIKDSSTSVVWSYYEIDTSKRVTFNANETGVSFSIETNNQEDDGAIYNAGIKSLSLIGKCFIDSDVEKWSDKSSWKSSTEISLVSAYKGLLEYLKKELPDTLIYWLVLPRYMIRKDAGYVRKDGTLDVVKYNELEGEDYNKLVKIQKEVCDLYNIPVIDVIKGCNINLSNIFSFYPENNVHPLDSGYKRWGETISRLI